MQKTRAFKLKDIYLPMILLKGVSFQEKFTFTLTCYYFSIYIVFHLLITTSAN